jgi:hypothetical protein
MVDIFNVLNIQPVSVEINDPRVSIYAQLDLGGGF